MFTVACRGRALAGTEGLSTQPRRVFQSLSGVLGLISRGSFSLSLVPPASPYCSFAGLAAGPVLRQTRLIEREGLLSADGR